MKTELEYIREKEAKAIELATEISQEEHFNKKEGLKKQLSDAELEMWKSTKTYLTKIIRRVA